MKVLLPKQPYWAISIVAIFGAVLYWSLWATDRYVSEANIVLQSASPAPPSLDFTSILTGGTSNELLMLRDHLRSVDMLIKLDRQLNLRDHYADPAIDRLSRLRSPSVPLEHLHRYYLKRVSIEMDEYAQVLRIRAQAYDPDTARAIASLLLQEGEKHMNVMGQRLAAEQVRFIELQVEDLMGRLDESREALIAYQNEHGLVSPTGTVESLSTVVATLEGELAKLNARRHALAASHSERSPEMVRLRHEIDAVRNQIDIEHARMATHSGEALNRISAEYESLRLQHEFSREMYASALAALENTRVEAARTLKQVSVLQAPTQPEYSTEPRRIYNITVFIIMAFLFSFIAHLIAAIVRDHRD
ncbi:chain-length determining protein [Alkalilimnicola ehrlichii]|uniref:Chain-length determining protein n=1 Tax=Alkalilimnicola ehrlichii TaxID=351052 RepID=A0A3E0WPA8_9GAMM|nr:chain-length determining protein [Alkalilimnicola ehrlichii]RFA27997.1 chain-length determining protein [Alkalilimnicola ehrlichii]RFA34648.1 chain-length determining protein [Alkalilimnicola ehrlichii]